MPLERLRLALRGAPRTRCPCCHDDLLAGERTSLCQACGAPHHPSCWEEFGACGACAATSATVVEPVLCKVHGCQRPAEVNRRRCALHELRVEGDCMLWAGLGLFGCFFWAALFGGPRSQPRFAWLVLLPFLLLFARLGLEGARTLWKARRLERLEREEGAA